MIVLFALTCPLNWGCSKNRNSGGASGEMPPSDSPTTAVLQPSLGGIAGRVLYTGADLPLSTRVRNTTDPHLCGTTQSLHNVLIAPDRGVQDVVISLGGVVLPEDYAPTPSRLILDNRDCQFEPHVAVLTAGSGVQTTNSDTITHTVHFYGLFNLNVALGPNQSKFVRRLERPGWYIVKCDLHDWMRSYLRVDEHPFHAVSTEGGNFRINNVPPGSYPVEAWHEHLGRQQEEVVVVVAGSITTLTIAYGNPSPG